MKRLLGVLVASTALAGVAGAQTAAPNRGFVEGVAQSAFGTVTSQSYGAEIGVTVQPRLQVVLEGGQTRTIGDGAFGAAAQSVLGYLTTVQAGVSVTAKEPVTFGALGVRYQVPVMGRLEPYVQVGAGLAKVKKDVTFSANGSDITGSLAQPPYFLTLGSDLSGNFNKPLLSVGGGVVWPLWRQFVIDLQYRYGRIFADGQGINLNRAGAGIGVRF